jgi:cytochrome c553
MITLSGPSARVAVDAAESQWIFGGRLNDSGCFDQRCSMCGRQDLRLTFEVNRARSDAASEICENCLGKEALALEQGGPVLHGEELRYQLSEMAVRVMQRTCRDVLRDLLASTSDNDMPEVAVYFDRNAQLSPRRAATLFMTLSSARRDVDPRIFEVQMRSLEHRREFGRLSEPEKLAVWPVLSQTVRKGLIALGLAPKRHALPQGKRNKPSRGQLMWDGATFYSDAGAVG